MTRQSVRLTIAQKKFIASIRKRASQKRKQAEWTGSLGRSEDARLLESEAAALDMLADSQEEKLSGPVNANQKGPLVA